MPENWECNCSKERFINAISALDPQDIMSMIKEDGGQSRLPFLPQQRVDYERTTGADYTLNI